MQQCWQHTNKVGHNQSARHSLSKQPLESVQTCLVLVHLPLHITASLTLSHLGGPLPERISQEPPEEDIEQTMDRFFGGILRSDVVCASCGYTSTAHDPFKDISVDILQPPHPKPQLPAVGVPKPNPVSASKSAAKSNKSSGKGTESTFCQVKPLSHP